MIRIVHLTDLHVAGAEAGNGGPKADTAAAVARAVALVNAMDPAPDLVVVSGDLTNHGDAASYRLVKDLLAPLRAPVALALGNHDKRAPFAEVFLGAASEAPHQHETVVAGLHVVTLDTLVPGQVAGRLDAERIGFLEAALARHPGLPKLVVAHHPPRLTERSLPWASLDAASTERLGAAIEGKGVVGVLSGHVHLDAVHLWRGVPVVTCIGLNSTVDLFETRDMRIVEGTSLGLVAIRPGGLSVAFAPLSPERRELSVLPEARLRAFR